MTWKRYTKKPVQVLAFEVTEQLRNDWAAKKIQMPKEFDIEITESLMPNDSNSCHMYVQTPEGGMEFDVGDFIVQDARKEYYPCSAQEFARAYEPEKGGGK